MIDFTAKPHLAISDPDYEAMRSVSPEMYWTLKRNCVVVTISKRASPGTLGLGVQSAPEEIISWLTSNATDLYHYNHASSTRTYKQTVVVSFLSPNDALAFKLRFDGYSTETTVRSPI